MTLRERPSADHASGQYRLEVPATFAEGVVGEFGDSGTAWLADLPGHVSRLLERWNLRPDGEVMHGFLAVVVPITRGGERLVLRVCQPSPEFENQLLTLRAWNGLGMVRLEDALPAEGAMLLERLDHRRSLDDIDVSEAVPAAAEVLRRLAVTGSGELPGLSEHVGPWPERWIDEWRALAMPLPRRLLDAAAAMCRDLAPSAGSALVDHDLHYRNVLAADREPWIAIDPRGVVGDAEFALAPLLWNRFGGPDDIPRRMAEFVDLAELDVDRALGWSLVRVVDYFLWSTRAGLTWDPAACHQIAEWIVDR